jgi:hypothetical protein
MEPMEHMNTGGEHTRAAVDLTRGADGPAR